MKKHLPVVAAAAAAALTLAGCAAGGEATPSPTQSDSSTTVPTADADANANPFGSAEDLAVLDGITWDEDDAGVPTLTFDTPSAVVSTATRVIEPGDGDTLVEGQSVTIGYTVTSGADGTVLYSTYDADASETLTLEELALDPALWAAFSSTSVGGKFIFATLDQTSEEPATLYMALTVEDAITPLDRAEGTTVEPAEGLPVVTLGDNGAPSIAVGDAEQPTELVVQPLIEGEGAVVEEGDDVTFHYTGWLWDETVFDSSWERATPSTFQLITGGLIDGWVQGLVGQTVGSQVLLVIPPDLAYGAEGNASVPGDATLIFVVDILAAA